MGSFKDKSFQKGPACPALPAGGRQAGQTLLIVVLIMVVSLTIGLSIASKTITNLRTTTEEADSAKALSAAETRVAQSIKSGASTGQKNLSNTVTFNASIVTVSGTTLLVNGGNVIPQDEGADVWLIAHDASLNLIFTPQWNGTLTIYWGDSSGNCTNAALEIITITGTTQTNPVSNRSAYDPCSTRSSSNKFASPTSSPLGGVVVSGKTFYYTADITNITNGLLVRIIPLYTNTTMAVSGGLNALPSQGSIISSTGQAGNVTRKISVVANYSSLPSEFFSYGLVVPS